MSVQQASRLRVSLPQQRLAAFARKWRIAELAVFGSALTDDFAADSDVDFLVTFARGASWGLLDLGCMEWELGEIVGRSADLVERAAVEASENYLRRRHILRNLEIVYVV